MKSIQLFFYPLQSSSASLWMKIRSKYDLPGRTPCCSSLRCESRAALKRSSMTGKYFLGKNIRLMPLQLSQTSALPFLKSITSTPLVQSFGTFSLFQVDTRRVFQRVIQARRNAFSISAVMPSIRHACLLFSFSTTAFTSSVLGGLALASLCKNGVSGTTFGSSGLSLCKTVSKFESHF